MTRALYDDGPACAYSTGTGDVQVAILGAPGAPVIASRADAARVFGEGTDDYNRACDALAYAEALPSTRAVKVGP